MSQGDHADKPGYRSGATSISQLAEEFLYS